MFGIGPQELAIVGILALLIFGPGKLPSIAWDMGSFVRKARRTMDEFKGELAFEEDRKGFHEGREEDRELRRR